MFSDLITTSLMHCTYKTRSTCLTYLKEPTPVHQLVERSIPKSHGQQQRIIRVLQTDIPMKSFHINEAESNFDKRFMYFIYVYEYRVLYIWYRLKSTKVLSDGKCKMVVRHQFSLVLMSHWIFWIYTNKGAMPLVNYLSPSTKEGGNTIACSTTSRDPLCLETKATLLWERLKEIILYLSFPVWEHFSQSVCLLQAR